MNTNPEIELPREQHSRVSIELNKASTREEVLGLALGAASSCWGNLTGAGTFDSTQAKLILDDTLARLQQLDRPPMTVGQLLLAVDRERARQVVQGYDAAHDDAEGLQHLLALGEHYAIQGDQVKYLAMIKAAREYLLRNQGAAS